MPLSAARCFSLQGTERNSALLLALELASQAEGRGLGASFAGLSSIALCGRAARHSRDRSHAPSFPNALGHLGRGRFCWGRMAIRRVPYVGCSPMVTVAFC